ncbi:MAG: hypothetical protein ABI791_02390 [Acidobacteriota bacterium]
MVRIILAVIAGFLAWSILWVGSDQVLMSLSPDWYGAHQLAFERAFTNKTAFEASTTILLMHLVREVIITLAAGYLTAVIARENRRSTLVLGVLLLLFGIGVQAMAWNYIPIWYHFLFLFLLVPLTMMGGRMRNKLA